MPGKVLISYAYFETENTAGNLEYFCRKGLFEDENTEFCIVVNGHKCSIDIPQYKNVTIIKRDNIGFDFGAHNSTLEHFAKKHNMLKGDLPYEYYIFMNCGVIGPFLPKYYKKKWPEVFTSRITPKIKLVGTSLVTSRETLDYTLSLCGIEGFCFCLDKIGLKLAINKGNIFINHIDKHSAVTGEFGLTETILSNELEIDCLLYMYKKERNWINIRNCNVNIEKFVSRQGRYDGLSLNPNETVFHKWLWAHEPKNLVSYDLFNYYLHLESPRKNENFLALYGNVQDYVLLTDILLDKFIKDGNLQIPAGEKLNDLCGDPCPGKIKKLTIKVNNKTFIYDENIKETIIIKL